MTNLSHDHTELRVDFPGWEARMAGRATFTIPHPAIRRVDVGSGWTSEILGVRSGLVISGYRKVGTFTHPDGTRRLVSMKRGLPLLRVGLDRGATGFDELLISTADAAEIAAALPVGAGRGAAAG